MKHVKKFEKYVNLEKLVDLSKIKKYIITKDNNNFYYLDQILDLNKKDDTIHLKTIYFYNKNTDISQHLNEFDDVLFTYLNKVIYSSDDYTETISYFNSIIDMFRDTNKYNI